MNKRVFLFGSIVLFVGSGVLFGNNIGNWLTVSEQPRQADVIICLNSSRAREQKVAELYQQGYADTILVTYVRTRAAVIKEGVPASAVVSLQGGYNSTFEEALDVVRFMDRENLRSAIIVSDPFHMYRSKWTYDFLNEEDSLALTYTAAGSAGGQFWWEERESRLFVLREIVKVPYYWLVHGMLGISYDPAWAIVAGRWYDKILLRFA